MRAVGLYYSRSFTSPPTLARNAGLPMNAGALSTSFPLLAELTSPFSHYGAGAMFDHLMRLRDPPLRSRYMYAFASSQLTD